MAFSAEQVFQQLQQDPENRRCIDCGKSGALWSSVTYGVYMCVGCIGPHRNLGTDLSYVKSLTLDLWAERHLALMRVGGNRKFREFLNCYQLLSAPFKTRYSSKAAEFYRDQLRALAQGTEFSRCPPLYEEGREPCVRYTQPPEENNRFGSYYRDNSMSIPHLQQATFQEPPVNPQFKPTSNQVRQPDLIDFDAPVERLSPGQAHASIPDLLTGD